MENKIIDVLKECYDPELPIDLWSLGLIYEINATPLEDGSHNVGIIMTLTTPGCTMGQYMADDIKSKLEQIKSVENVTVEVVFDPPWQPEMMTDEGRQKLGFAPTENTKKSEKKDWE